MLKHFSTAHNVLRDKLRIYISFQFRSECNNLSLLSDLQSSCNTSAGFRLDMALSYLRYEAL